MKNLLFIFALLFATQVMAQDYSALKLSDPETLQFLKNKDNHFSFMGISFCQDVDDFLGAIEDKDCVYNSSYTKMMDQPGKRYYDGMYNGEKAKIFVMCHKKEFVFGAGAIIEYKDKNSAIAKQKKILEKIKDKYQTEGEMSINDDKFENWIFSIYNTEKYLTGKIALDLFTAEAKYFLTINYYDIYNVRCDVSANDEDI